LEKGLRQALKHSYSRLGILRRLFGVSRRLPVMLAVNFAFRRRVMAWASGDTR